jgi:preprotein translocase subunit SecD
VIDRVPVVTGRDLRSATAVRSTKNIGFFDVDFTLSTEAGRRFGPFTEQNIGKELGIVLEHRLQTAPVINGRIDDTGVIEGQFGEQGSKRSWPGLALRSASGVHQVSGRAHGRARRSARIPSGTACRLRSSACWS